MNSELKSATRRLFIGCGLSTATLLLKAAASKQPPQILNLVISPDGCTLSYFDGDKASPMGFIVGSPQCCRSARPGGTSSYGTPEWIKEITYVEGSVYDDDAVKKARAAIGSARITNDNPSTGCGHISKNVPVTKITFQHGRVIETVYKSAVGDLFYSLAAAGTQADQTSPFVVTDVWISDNPWPPGLSQYKSALRRPLPKPVCQ